MIIFLFFLFVIGLMTFTWAVFIEPRCFKINRHEISVKKSLPRPVKILHLTDIHFAYPNPPLSRFFDKLSWEKVDFIFITGDVFDSPEGIEVCKENLSKLRARYGIYAVLGNHDYFDYRLKDVFFHNFPGQTRPLMPQPAELFKKTLEELGIKVLANETEKVEIDGTAFLIHGLDDPTTGRADLLKAMKNFDPGKPNFLLTHTIDVFLDIGEGQIDLSLSGHSHGGQIRVPFLGPLITHTSLGRPYASGIFDLKGALCVVSRGVHASRFFGARLLCPPEAILLTVQGS